MTALEQLKSPEEQTNTTPIAPADPTKAAQDAANRRRTEEANNAKAAQIDEDPDAELERKLQALENGQETKKNSFEEKINNAVQETKSIELKPYDNNGRVNGGERAKAIQIIHNNISWGSKEGLEAWEKSFYKILSPNGQIIKKISLDNDSKAWELKDGTIVSLNTKLFSNEEGYITITHPNKLTETFDTNGNPLK